MLYSHTQKMVIQYKINNDQNTVSLAEFKKLQHFGHIFFVLDQLKLAQIHFVANFSFYFSLTKWVFELSLSQGITQCRIADLVQQPVL